jgi:hypothetical protein
VKDEVRLAKARVSSIERSAGDRLGVAATMADAPAREGLRMAVSPPSMSGTLRNVGAVLLVSPDPFTGVPGVALLTASYAMKGREAAKVASLAAETAQAMRTIRELKMLL